MGFHALFERENVLDILQKTLQDYYKSRFPDKQVYIGYENREGAAEFFLIPRVGMILQAKPSREICRSFYNTYNIRKNIVKHVAAKTLVFLGLHFPWLLAKKQRLYVWPGEMVNKKTVFSYCNRSIRVFDYEQGTTVSIQKNGFTDKFFQNQLQFRLKHPYPFIPELLDNGTDWFEEKILTGSVLARVTDEQQYQRAQEQTLALMEQVQKNTMEAVSAQDYIEDLCNRLEVMLQITAREKETAMHGYGAQYLAQLKHYLKNAPQTLSTVTSHKDLQGGNIMVTPKKTWIIDWETQGRGSRWFDAITMLYGTRYYGGIRKLTQDVLADTLTVRIGPTEGWTPKQILAIFLLEDLEFYLEDMLELPGNAGSTTFDRYMSEIQEIDWNTVFDARFCR